MTHNVIAQEEFPLTAYLQLVGKQLPHFMRSLESMHAHVKKNYTPGTLPPRYHKENILRCPDIASPDTLFSESIGMQIVLMVCGTLSRRPFLRVAVLHNALVYLTEHEEPQTKSKEYDNLATDLLWMLFVDTSRIALQWDAICANVLSTKILPTPTAAMAESPRLAVDGFPSQPPIMNYIKHRKSRAVQVLLRKYGKKAHENNEQPAIFNRMHTEQSVDSGWQQIFKSMRAESIARRKSKKRHSPFRTPDDDDFMTCSFVATDEVDPIHAVARLNFAFHRVRNLVLFLHNLPSIREQSMRDLICLAKRNGPMLVVAPSQITAAGYGVYVCGSLPANTRLGLYAGLFVPKNSTVSGRSPHQTGEDTGYLLYHNTTTNIDGASVRPLVAMINDYRDRSAATKRAPNCRFCYNRHIRSVRTTRAVQNEELLIFYGSGYSINAGGSLSHLSRMRHGEYACLYDWPYRDETAATIIKALKE
ncbi:hypothetical protein XU18_2001 [Perkinsela sp. CCAP 1560/4]|nr:hypothetical protein XU18_2001 [Perkinsela sp. CCAP 1560/4]|eukprot:KNH07469.1 hypothetical protein XU18_2001 [Perkinsela sp. CCAP 1560/4]